MALLHFAKSLNSIDHSKYTVNANLAIQDHECAIFYGVLCFMGKEGKIHYSITSTVTISTSGETWLPFYVIGLYPSYPVSLKTTPHSIGHCGWDASLQQITQYKHFEFVSWHH